MAGHRWLASVALAIAVLVLLGQVAHVWPYVSDDAFISLRYAEHLVTGHGLTWNDGEYVEGYTNLLWVLASSALLAIGLDGLTAVRVLGAGCSVAALWILARTGRAGVLGQVVPPVLVAASAPVMLWTCGGLEGPMVLLFGCWSTAVAVGELRSPRSAEDAPQRRGLVAAGLPFALLCLTRADAPLWVGLTLVTLGVHRAASNGARAGLRRLLALALLPGLAVAGQVAFRLVYYGEPVPNTALAKVGWSSAAFAAGVAYLGSAAGTLRGLLLLVGVAVATGLGRRGCRPWLAVLGLPVVGLVGWLATIGGDHFPGYRMLLIAVGPLAVLGGLGLEALAARGSRWRLLAVAVASGAGLLLAVDARLDPGIEQARRATWVWEARAVGQTYARVFSEQRPTLAIDSAGALPYFSGLPCIDMLGLTDRAIARRGPRTDIVPGRFVPGHMLGDGDLVLQRRPDLVSFTAPGTWQPMWASAVDLDRDASFRRDYRCVQLAVPATLPFDDAAEVVRACVWVRLFGRVGVRDRGSEVAIPAWLLAGLEARGSLLEELERSRTASSLSPMARRVLAWSTRQALAVPRGSRLWLEVAAGTPGMLEGLPLRAGTWQISVEPEGTGLTASLTGRDGEPLPRDGAAFVVAAERVTVRVELPVGSASPRYCERIVLRPRE